MARTLQEDPESNWGNCTAPKCIYQATRCAMGYCRLCCDRLHTLPEQATHKKPPTWTTPVSSPPVLTLPPVREDVRPYEGFKVVDRRASNPVPATPTFPYLSNFYNNDKPVEPPKPEDLEDTTHGLGDWMMGMSSGIVVIKIEGGGGTEDVPVST